MEESAEMDEGGVTRTGIAGQTGHPDGADDPSDWTGFMTGREEEDRKRAIQQIREAHAALVTLECWAALQSDVKELVLKGKVEIPVTMEDVKFALPKLEFPLETSSTEEDMDIDTP